MRGMTEEGSISSARRACPHCGALIRTKALQCVHCREWIRDERATPPLPRSAAPEKGSDARPAVARPHAAYSRGQLPAHLVTLWVLTLGAYSFYWFYRNWRDLADITDDEIHPGLRTLGLVVPFLNIYLAYQQFRVVGDLAAADGDRLRYDPGVLAALFFSLVAVGRLDFREAAHGQLELGLRGKGMEREEFKELPVLEACLFVLAILVEGVGQVDEGLIEGVGVVGHGVEGAVPDAHWG